MRCRSVRDGQKIWSDNGSFKIAKWISEGGVVESTCKFLINRIIRKRIGESDDHV